MRSDQPNLYVVKDDKQRVPLLYMGDGMGRLASILLAISSAAGGGVVIDEIENGIHHSCLEALWSVIFQAAAQSKTQVFATTHSYECIEASPAGREGGELFQIP